MHKTRIQNTIPAHVAARLSEIRERCREAAEESTRKARALRAAERYETWEEVRSLTVPLRKR
tara:strand:- start:5254 stop:5439 length:186 start_codon:yes stop_codon:yes gene_type:complete